MGKPTDINDYERMTKLDKFLSTHTRIDASSISEEDNLQLVIKLIEKYLEDNGQEKNYDEIKWYEDEENEESLPEITVGDCDVNIYFVIGEINTEKYSITLKDIKFFKDASQIVNSILELFEKPLTSLALNTLVTEEFLLDYINEKIKIISKQYTAKFPYQADKNKTLVKGKNNYRIEIYKDDEKIDFSKYIFIENDKDNSFISNTEINIKADILDANEIKKQLNQIANNIKSKPINKYELQTFISSNNLQKTERLNSFLKRNK